MDGYTLNAARTIREYESSIQRPKAERTINDSILSALLRGDGKIGINRATSLPGTTMTATTRSKPTE